MTDRLSHTIQKIKASVIFTITSRAAELRAQGKDILSLGAGEPDFDTPLHIKEAAIKAIQDGRTKYTASEGILPLREAIAHKFKTENNLTYDPKKEIIVSVGAKQAISNAFQALLDEGDEVIIPSPYWVSYPDMALLAHASPTFIPTTIKTHFKITPAQLEGAITPQTKIVILNSPSNPSGVTYTHEELSALAKVLLQHPRIIILSDDIYEHILWSTEPFCNIVNACPELKDRTLVINGVSKAFAMTGWRIGYTAASADIIAAMKKNQEQSTSNPCSIAQYAALSALTDPRSVESIKIMCAEFKKRHDFFCSAINSIPGFHCVPAHGAFYTFADVSEVMDRLKFKDDVAFAEHLLVKHGLAAVPGSAFGVKNCIRFSFATSMETLEDAVRRLRMV